MDKVQAEESIKLIRDIMERSTRYTNFSGLSGIIAGVLAIVGCAATLWWAYYHVWWKEIPVYVGIWVIVFVLAVGQDAYFARKKAKSNGESFWNPATVQVVKAVTPGVLMALVLSIRALSLNQLDPIPSLWAIGYGVAACAAGMFSVKEVTILGIAQLVTGTVGLFLASNDYTSFVTSITVLLLSFGLYHILFGVWMSRKYGW